jgi:two-component system LytT family response regulator
MKVKAVVVDDEGIARKTLKALLQKYCEDVDVVGEAETVQEAVTQIEKTKPDLVFLDIKMPEEDGFSLFNYFDEPGFAVIFTTAYDQYAMNAIKVSAVDYLMKPIDVDELIIAVKKVKDQIKLYDSNVVELYKRLKKEASDKLIVPTVDGYHLINYDDLVYCEADRNYTKIVMKDEGLLSSKTLKYFESKLPVDRFYRSHKSYLINLSHIKKITKGQQSKIEMSNGDITFLSKDRKELILKFFSS